MSKFNNVPIYQLFLLEDFDKLCQSMPLEELLREENLLMKEWNGQQLDEFQKSALIIVRKNVKAKLR